MGTVWFRYPDPCPDCGRAHVYCCQCGWRHTIERPDPFYCVRCGAQFGTPDTPKRLSCGQTQQPDLSDRQQLERLIAAPAATRPEPAIVPTTSTARMPDRVDLARFLWQTYPKGSAGQRTADIYDNWAQWCAATQVQPRTLTWVGRNLHQVEGAHRFASGRQWRIQPAPPRKDQRWLAACINVGQHSPAVAAIARRDARLVEVTDDGTATVVVPEGWMRSMRKAEAWFCQGLRVSRIIWHAA